MEHTLKEFEGVLHFTFEAALFERSSHEPM